MKRCMAGGMGGRGLVYSCGHIGLCPPRSYSLPPLCGWEGEGVRGELPPLTHQQEAFQLQEYQTDVGRCRFDTLGKLNPAHRAGPPTVRGRWVCPLRWVSASVTAAGPPTRGGALSTVPEWWVAMYPGLRDSPTTQGQ